MYFYCAIITVCKRRRYFYENCFYNHNTLALARGFNNHFDIKSRIDGVYIFKKRVGGFPTLFICLFYLPTHL